MPLVGVRAKADNTDHWKEQFKTHGELFKDQGVSIAYMGATENNSVLAIFETDDLERDLYVARKKIEKSAREMQLKDFYICSLSSRSIVYKGMFLAESLADFYPDLKNKNFLSNQNKKAKSESYF